MVSGSLVLRTAGDPLSVLPSVRAAVNDVGPELRIQNVRTLESAVDRELLPWRFQTALLDGVRRLRAPDHRGRDLRAPGPLGQRPRP